MDPLVPLFLSLFSFILGIALVIFTEFFKPKTKEWVLLVWACLFFGVGFGLVEYAVWIGGENIFEVLFSPNFPLLAYFAVWIGFLIWLFEKRGKREIWLLLLALLITTVLIAVNCMDCIRF